MLDKFPFYHAPMAALFWSAQVGISLGAAVIGDMGVLPLQGTPDDICMTKPSPKMPFSSAIAIWMGQSQ